jgi:hypothetical protein
MNVSSKIPRSLNFNHAQILGAGGYGIIVSYKDKVFKLLKDPTAYDALKREATIQEKAYKLFRQHLPEVSIPRISYVTTEPIAYRATPYLCGIEMDRLEPPEGFEEQVHILLGYKEDDIDSEWGMRMSEPPSETNPTRGFFASPETLEYLWKEEGSSMTIEKIARTMGKALRLLLENGLLPIDLEWVWSNGKPALIDFGLCEIGTVDPIEFLSTKGVRGLADDFYIPHEGDRGYTEFMKAYLS